MEEGLPHQGGGGSLWGPWGPEAIWGSAGASASVPQKG